MQPEVTEAWSLLATALDPCAPSSGARARLLSVLAGPARYLPFVADLSGYFDLPEARMRELLARIDEPGAWTAGVAPIQGFLHFRPGPTVAPLHGGFVRMQRGMRFPLHRHRDRELSYVLSGALRDGDGNRYGPGDLLDMAPGSIHTLQVDEETEALVALLHGGIEMLG